MGCAQHVIDLARGPGHASLGFKRPTAPTAEQPHRLALGAFRAPRAPWCNCVSSIGSSRTTARLGVRWAPGGIRREPRNPFPVSVAGLSVT